MNSFQTHSDQAVTNSKNSRNFLHQYLHGTFFHFHYEEFLVLVLLRRRDGHRMLQIKRHGQCRRASVVPDSTVAVGSFPLRCVAALLVRRRKCRCHAVVTLAIGWEQPHIVLYASPSCVCILNLQRWGCPPWCLVFTRWRLAPLVHWRRKVVFISKLWSVVALLLWRQEERRLALLARLATPRSSHRPVRRSRFIDCIRFFSSACLVYAVVELGRCGSRGSRGGRCSAGRAPRRYVNAQPFRRIPLRCSTVEVDEILPRVHCAVRVRTHTLL